MKIVFLHTDFRVYWLPRLNALGACLRAAGHELVVVEIAGKGSYYAFAEQHTVNENLSWLCLFPNKDVLEIKGRDMRTAICKCLDEQKPDLLFSGAFAFPSGATALKYCRRTGLPLIIFDNVRNRDVPRSAFTNFIKGQLYSGVDAMLVPAPSYQKDYVRWGFQESQIFYGLNVTDNHFWEELCEQARRSPEKDPYPERFYLGVGRQVPIKNWSSLLEAFSKSEMSCPLLLVGTGPERNNLLEYVKRNHLQEMVLFSDFLPPRKLAPLYLRAEALILPSFGETWGMVVSEAMACGTPVLVSKQCGCCETLCKDGVTGFRFLPDAEHIAEALRQFDGSTREQKMAMRESAKNLIAQWGIERFCESVLAIIKQYGGKKMRHSSNPVRSLLIMLWNGRYRPN